MIGHVRRLDSLETLHDVTKSALLLYGRDDATGVGALLRQVLQRQPLYLPAFDGLRGHPRFATLLEVVRRHAVREHAELLQLRAAGVIPDRS